MMDWKNNFSWTTDPLIRMKQERRRRVVEIAEQIQTYKHEFDIDDDAFAARFPEIIKEFKRLQALDSDEIQA